LRFQKPREDSLEMNGSKAKNGAVVKALGGAGHEKVGV